MTRISNRTYPARKCPHCSKSFIPHDYRQKYCSKQHKIDAANDRRRMENSTRFINEKYLRFVDRILERGYNRIVQLKIQTVTRRELQMWGIERFDISVETLQDENNHLIIRFYEYGLQTTNPQATEFKILKLK